MEPISQLQLERFIDQLAEQVVRRKLETPALMFLEMHLPITSIAHTSTLFFQPLLGPVFGAERFHTLSQFLSERKNVDALIQRIKSMSEATQAA